MLFELYDNYRLWTLSTDMNRDIRELDLERVLGSRMNADELQRLPGVIESVDFTDFNPNWTS